MEQITALLSDPMVFTGIFVFILVAVIGLILMNLLSEQRKARLTKVLMNKMKSKRENYEKSVLSTKKVMNKSSRGEKMPFESINWFAIVRDMRKAGLPPFPPILFVGAVVLAFFVARFIVNAPIFSLLTQFLAILPFTWLLVRFSFVKIMINGRKMKALKQLVVFIESTERAVSVGTSTEDAIIEAINDSASPLKDNLVAIKDLLELGYDFVEAIQLAADQVDLPEFDIFVGALTAQSGTGGSIGNVLRDVVDIARSRMDLQSKIATMTAEGRFNALLLGSIPIALNGYLRTAQPDYFNALWESDFLGPMLFFMSLGMAFLGAIVALKIASIKV